MGLLERHVEFVTALRGAGLAVSVAEDLDATRAVAHIDLLDREALRETYAACLVKRQAARPGFDTLFDLYFPARTGTPATEDPNQAPAPRGPIRDDPQLMVFREQLQQALAEGDDAALQQLAVQAVGTFGRIRPGSGSAPAFSRHAALSRVSADTLMAGLLRQVLDERDGLPERTARTMLRARIARFEAMVGTEVSRRLAEVAGPQDVARHAVRPSIDQVDLLSATRTDLAAIRREIQPLARRLAARLAVEQRRGRRGPLDFRRTIRASLSSGGHAVETVHRPRRPHKTDLVVICDVSESVSSFARFTLLLVFALRAQFSRVRVFAFVDELAEVTDLIDPADDLGESLLRFRSVKVRGFYGRTDYGRAFGQFAERHLDAITPRTSVLILGDARSNYGNPALPALRRIAGSARRAYWLNPERRTSWNSGDSVAEEFGAVVAMTECRTLRQLGSFVRDLV